MGSKHALRGCLNLWSVGDIKTYHGFSSLGAGEGIGEGEQGGKEEEQKEEEEGNALPSLCTLIT